MLSGKKVVLGVTGSIAAYKAAFLVRELIKAGASVKVILTPASLDFVTPLTLATLSKNPVLSEFVADKDEGTWNNHVDLGLWADFMLIAPATANTLSKMAQSESDNLLLATYLSAKCPVYIAPAMDLDMYRHPGVKANLETLEGFGNVIIPAEAGELASGLVGEGRMAEPEHIRAFLEKHLQKGLPLYGKKVLVSAGPTYEAIDPVRFIGNHSSGKMGFALAEQAASLGATVTLVSGPTSQSTDHPGIKRIDVVSAADMLEACQANFEESNITIMSAAVADYRPAQVATSKMKKQEGSLHIELEPTQDVLKTLGGLKRDDQLLIGFALETDNEQANAEGKLKRKNLDLIVLNSLRDAGAGFGHDTNRITLIDRNNKMASFELKSKVEVSKDIFGKILELLPE